MNIQDAIKKVVESQNLSFEEAYSTMNSIMTGQATPAQIACFITALRMKKETPGEIAGLAKAMQELATDLGVDGTDFIDVVGTGGDGKHTFNISTASAIIAAGAGAKVAKHGNKSVSSKCGSADVFAACGVNIQADIQKVTQSLKEIEDAKELLGLNILGAIFHRLFKLGARRLRHFLLVVVCPKLVVDPGKFFALC